MANLRMRKEDAFPDLCEQNRLPAYRYPAPEELPSAVGFESELPKGSSNPHVRRHLKRSREGEGHRPIDSKQSESQSLEPEDMMDLDKPRVGLGSEPPSRGEDIVQPPKPLRDRPRRFAPEVIETGKRSFRRGSPGGISHQATQSKQITGNASRSPEGNAMDSAPESRFSYSSLVRRQGKPRSHSFRVPDLPTIPSNLNEVSEDEPLSAISSSSESPDEPVRPSNHVFQHRESCDEQQAEYLLSLAARSAQKRLKEQALAAFPNEQVYQPVDHFAIDREEDEHLEHEELAIDAGQGTETRYRRASSADLSWALEHMRLHKEEAETRNRAMIGTNKLQDSAAVTMPRALPDENAPNPGLISAGGENTELAPGERPDNPPMLGDDLIFPQSMSPEGTLCPSVFGISTQRGHSKEDPGGLWGGNLQADNNRDGGGLWMGTCKPAEETATSPITLRRSRMDLDGATASRPTTPVPTPQADIERKRRLQEINGNEFHDGFVTQIYNYLSLGYPCVARYYDYELSEVSGIAIQDLRRDDLHTDAKGYTGITRGASDSNTSASKCLRWVALRLYIHEFARKQTTPVETGPTIEAWGTHERKGSWAG